MDELLATAVGFFTANTPTWGALSIGGPLGLAWSFTALWVAGRLKRGGTRTGYTRKTFHFLIFGTVAALEWRLGTPAVCLFGATCTVAVFVAVWRGAGNVLYEAIARERDEPHRTHFVLVPYFATLVGGLAANILCGPVAVAGYLVTGLGDAIGEPVGTRFGAHRYRVPSLSSVPAVRSLEGSAAVFVMSGLALLAAAAVSPAISVDGARAWTVLLIAAVCAAVEAVSPHGWDNLTLQIVPTILAGLWLGTQ
jgi:phytol kinase